MLKVFKITLYIFLNTQNYVLVGELLYFSNYARWQKTEGGSHIEFRKFLCWQTCQEAFGDCLCDRGVVSLWRKMKDCLPNMAEHEKGGLRRRSRSSNSNLKSLLRLVNRKKRVINLIEIRRLIRKLRPVQENNFNFI